MRTPRLALLAGLVFVAFASNSTLLRAQEPLADSFVPLFNGRDLEGWINVNCGPETWSVRDGLIYCTGQPIGELRTTKMYQNFVLELEWRHLKPQGNAGVFVWADALPARGQPFHRAIEVQVLDGREGDWYTSDGDIFPIHGAVMKPINGRGGDRAFPTEKRAKPSPEWNHYRIVCQDGSISLAVNGKVVTRGEQCSPRKGYICLESEGSPAEFRNLRIQELPGDDLPAEMIADEDRGFVSLYNGIDLTGWRVRPGLVGHWRPNDWVLAYDGAAEGEEPHLWSEKSYRDFVLIADWRWPGDTKETSPQPVVLPSGEYKLKPDGNPETVPVPNADSGIYLRGNDKSQVNIWQWPIGSGEVYGYRTDAHQPAEVRAGVTPKKRADRPAGEWNRFHITMVGDRLTVVLNGETVLDQAQLPGVPDEGPIALQHHGSPVEFANIFVREL